MRYHVHWINHQYNEAVEVFLTEDEARKFIEKNLANVTTLFRVELIESFNA